MTSVSGFTFQTTFVAAANSRGRLYTTTVHGPHGEASASADTALAAVTQAATVYQRKHLCMVPAAE